MRLRDKIYMGVAATGTTFAAGFGGFYVYLLACQKEALISETAGFDQWYPLVLGAYTVCCIATAYGLTKLISLTTTIKSEHSD
jgi:uncharacterized membrane protein YdcZ (DUF606 family)